MAAKAPHPQLVSVLDYARLAKANLSVPVWGYFQAGAGDEITLKENTFSWKTIHLRPRLLRAVNNISLKTKILGFDVEHPIGIAPSAFHKLAHEDGEIGMALAAREMNTCMVLSTLSSTSIEDFSNALKKDKKTGGVFWLQLYIFRDREMSLRLIRRAEAAGFTGLVLTIDAPGGLGVREIDVRNNFCLPPDVNLAHFKDDPFFNYVGSTDTGSAVRYFSCQAMEDSLTWEVIDWLKSVTKLPIIVKGVLRADDALLAAKRGVAAVWVSNHGGRQLDTFEATASVLYSVSQALKGSGVEVYVDSGIRRGTDVLKCLALGANFVFVGRPTLWGLAAHGKEGVKKVLSILNLELHEAMKLTGQTDVSKVENDIVSIPLQRLAVSPAFASLLEHVSLNEVKSKL